MKYFVLIIGLVMLGWAIWILNGRADELAQNTVDYCNRSFEDSSRIAAEYRVDNSDNINANFTCAGDAYADAESTKSTAWVVGVIGSILAFLSYLVIKGSNHHPHED